MPGEIQKLDQGKRGNTQDLYKEAMSSSQEWKMGGIHPNSVISMHNYID
jgi:hypothetical protein